MKSNDQMHRYFIYLAYDGTAYHGWQIQPNGISVQEVLQNALSTILRFPVEVVGAGRTDTGVHASEMVAHFETEDEQDCGQITYRINKVLPRDIVVNRIVPVTADAHARFSATARTYHYFLTCRKDPFNRFFTTRIYGPLDFKKMNEAAQLLLSYRDFTSFSKVHTDVKTNNCHITQAEWTQTDEHTWRFTIKADRFLRNMVRAVVGTLIDVGRGKLSLEDFRAVIEGKNRCDAAESVPAKALFLVKVDYPVSIFLTTADMDPKPDDK
jgi:tRNA pseudouridine38-40 synthase